MEDYYINELKNSFESRCKKNHRYSLRTFAKSLNISPATLSGVLNGKRRPSLTMIEKTGIALGWKTEEILRHQKNHLGLELNKISKKYNVISQDIFNVISDWYHLTILEVMKLDDFKPDPKWIATRLNLGINQIKLALERLQRVGILEITKNGKWVDKTSGFTTHYIKDITSESKKHYQMQLLEKSRESLLQDDFSIRDHSSMTMAIDPDDIMFAKQEIINFRKHMSSILEKTKNPKEVYQLQISLYPLTKNRRR